VKITSAGFQGFGGRAKPRSHRRTNRVNRRCCLEFIWTTSLGIFSDLEPSRVGIPVLLRQYLKLGGKLLGLNVDPEFLDALDGLIVVDRAGPNLRR
jgi:hypothetical protein